MPFSDSPRGQTHHQNDGCGIKEHNDMPEETKEWWNDKWCELPTNEFIVWILAERDAQWIEKLEGMKRFPRTSLEARSLKLKVRNQAFDEAKKLFT